MICLEHEVHGLVGDVHVGVLLLLRERVQALVLGIPRAGCEEARPAGNRERGDHFLIFLVHPTECVERRHLVVVHALHHGELGGLLFGHLNGGRVRGHDHGARGDDADDGPDAHRFHGEVGVLVLEQVPSAQGERRERTDDQQRNDHVKVARGNRGVHGCCEEVGDDSLLPIGCELGAGGRLHPRVSDEDPERTQKGACPHKPCRHGVELGRNLVATEQQHAQEHRLQEESEQRLCGKRGAEDIAYEARVIRPVRAEGELHRDARRHTDGERRGEDLHPEAHRSAVLLVVRAVVLRRENRRDQAQPDRERDEYEVVRNGKRKLDT